MGVFGGKPLKVPGMADGPDHNAIGENSDVVAKAHAIAAQLRGDAPREETAIISREESNRLGDGVELRANALILPESLSYDAWVAIGHELKKYETGIQWWIGDWIAFGERRYGEMYANAIDESQAKTWRNYVYVAQSVKTSRRRDNVSWSHHAEIASLKPAQQEELLDWCEQPVVEKTGDVRPRAALRAEIRKRRQMSVSASMPADIFNVVLADPPWQYGADWGTGVADNHYPTMPLEDIAALPEKMGLQVADDAVLFLWVTNPFIVKALTVIEAWGFEYKSNIVWVKTELDKPGVGFYVRGRHELLFICTRGAFTPLDKAVSPPIGSVLESPIGEHSAKPEEVYSIIERLYPGCRYIELFARQSREGWAAYGSDIAE